MNGTNIQKINSNEWIDRTDPRNIPLPPSARIQKTSTRPSSGRTMVEKENPANPMSHIRSEPYPTQERVVLIKSSPIKSPKTPREIRSCPLAVSTDSLLEKQIRSLQWNGYEANPDALRVVKRRLF